MQLLLGLVAFSILLTTGSSLTCEYCASPISDTCSGTMKTCPYKNAACMTLTTEMTLLMVKIITIMKSCSLKDECKQLQAQKGNILPGPSLNMSDIIHSFQVGAVIKEVLCDSRSAAPPSSASFFPAVLGLLLTRLLLF